MQAHIDAQLRIEVRERLIEHKHPGITHDCPANGHALPLAARELLRFTIQQVRELQRFSHHFHLATDLRFRHFIHLQPVAHVLCHRHVRVERIGLEDHRHAAAGGHDIIHHLIADQHFTLADLFQTGNHAQQRRFSTAGRTDENGKLAIFNIEIDLVQRHRAAEPFGDIPQSYIGHPHSPK